MCSRAEIKVTSASGAAKHASRRPAPPRERNYRAERARASPSVPTPQRLHALVSSSQRPLLNPYVRKDVTNVRVALVGATERPERYPLRRLWKSSLGRGCNSIRRRRG